MVVYSNIKVLQKVDQFLTTLRAQIFAVRNFRGINFRGIYFRDSNREIKFRETHQDMLNRKIKFREIL